MQDVKIKLVASGRAKPQTFHQKILSLIDNLVHNGILKILAFVQVRYLDVKVVMNIM